MVRMMLRLRFVVFPADVPDARSRAVPDMHTRGACPGHAAEAVLPPPFHDRARTALEIRCPFGRRDTAASAATNGSVSSGRFPCAAVARSLQRSASYRQTALARRTESNSAPL